MRDSTRLITYNWRGQGASSVLPNGKPGDCSISHGSGSTEIDWPALSQSGVYYTPGPGIGVGFANGAAGLPKPAGMPPSYNMAYQLGTLGRSALGAARSAGWIP